MSEHFNTYASAAAPGFAPRLRSELKSRQRLAAAADVRATCVAAGPTP